MSDPMLEALERMHETTRKEVQALWKLSAALNQIIEREENLEEAREIIRSYIGNPGNNERDKDLRRVLHLMGTKKEATDVAESALETVSTLMSVAAELFAVSERMMKLMQPITEEEEDQSGEEPEGEA